MVQLPGGGSRRVDLSSPGSETVSPGLVGNLAAGAGAEVTVGQRQRPSRREPAGRGRAVMSTRRAQISGRLGHQRDRTPGREHPRGRHSERNGAPGDGAERPRREIDRRRGGPGIRRGRSGTGLAVARPVQTVRVGGLPQQQSLAASLWCARADLTRPIPSRRSRRRRAQARAVRRGAGIEPGKAGSPTTAADRRTRRPRRLKGKCKWRSETWPPPTRPSRAEHPCL